ncbi:hypothetical protein HNQ50_004322 [Silvimonas terrae]|uniref:DUF4862 family protein n=1 Tax=Silvimonas terrae TaxID=300266 RepID=A0A840RLS8_9NEIS|nr:DUF4862 family protein [Silvimonas terrae]MBB5193564.1 hypothetical protein [Silvimonas terrae]
MQNLKTGYTVGAYTCAPSFHQGSAQEESRFWKQLAQMPLVGGVEQPCLDELHPLGDDFLLSHLAPHWHVVLTAIMGTMQKRQVQRDFGLASENEEARVAAVRFMAHIFAKTRKLNDHAGRAVVRAVELHSAPASGVAISGLAASAFLRSLAEIASWDWECPLVVEHCDSRTGIEPRKGFLSLEEEIQVVHAVAADFPQRQIGLCVNWARSVLETHSKDTPLTHIAQCQRAGLLKGLMFSGTAAVGEYGPWTDLHAPFAPFAGARFACPDSLLGVRDATACFQQAPANTLEFAGIKLLAINPHAELAERLGIIEDGVTALSLAAA